MRRRTNPSPEDALSLLISSHEGALGTIEKGTPFVSAAGFLYETPEGEKDFGKLYFLLSDLSRHSKNLQKNAAASLLVVEKGTAPIHERKRLSLQGLIQTIKNETRSETLKDRYLTVFPRSEIFFTLADFHFYEMEITELHWIGGFGKAANFK